MKYFEKVLLYFTFLFYFLNTTYAASVFDLEENIEIVGQAEIITAVYEDTLIDLARTHNLGFTEIVMANRTVDKWLPGVGTIIRLPKKFIIPNHSIQNGITINLPEYRGYYMNDGKLITFPIGIGRMDWATPLGISKVDLKLENPAWYPPKSVQQEYKKRGEYLSPVVPPGSLNPLGKLAMRIDIPGGYFIHGTNKPDGVGMQVSHGCIRLFPEDIQQIFPLIEINTPVMIVDQPFKIGILGDEILLEIHETLSTDDVRNNFDYIQSMVKDFLSINRIQPTVDWATVKAIFEEKTGIPAMIVQFGETESGLQ
jgi:L,D-transpeptidase ErfK/SrfK